MLCTYLSRATAIVLGLAGVAFVFAPRELLGYLTPGTPPTTAWIGQLLGAALYALAFLNWMSRTALLGGIYGRNVVPTSAMFFLIASSSVFGASYRPGAGAGKARVIAVILDLFAVSYTWLLFRGPLKRDMEAYRVMSGGGAGGASA